MREEPPGSRGRLSTTTIRQVEKLIERRLGVAIEDTSPLRLILTVLAVWSDRAKEATMQALVPEPEAAALYSLPTMQLSEGDMFTVCDAGGGTVSGAFAPGRICGVKVLQHAAEWDPTGSESNQDLVPESIVQGIRRLLHEYPTYSTHDLLPALQFLLILLIILFFCLGTTQASKTPQTSKSSLKSGKPSAASQQRACPSNQPSPKPAPPRLRLVRSPWAPHLLCWELGPLPAPPPRYLWEVGNEETWKRMYARLLQQWMDVPYLMSEMFALNGEAPLEPRAERWLAEADKFGMMLMAEGTITLWNRVPEGGNPHTCGRV